MRHGCETPALPPGRGGAQTWNENGSSPHNKPQNDDAAILEAMEIDPALL
jgi:hypothetical protein